jgi:hypothetical protein
MLTIDNKLITVMDTIYLLSNYEGFLDGDEKCLKITGSRKTLHI